jgi:hypothetical protein
LEEASAHLTSLLAADGVLICGRGVGAGRGARLVRLARNASGEIEASDLGSCLLPKPIGAIAEAL